MSGSGRSLLLSSILLVLVLIAVAFALAFLATPAALMSAVGWVVVAMAGFILLQLLVFHLVGLRSRADDEGDPGARSGADDTGQRTHEADEGPDQAGGHPPRRDEADWRIWRG